MNGYTLLVILLSDTDSRWFPIIILKSMDFGLPRVNFFLNKLKGVFSEGRSVEFPHYVDFIRRSSLAEHNY